MGWASTHIERLRAGETVSFRPRGNSMRPRIESGALCTVAPVDPATLAKGDVVLCTVGGAQQQPRARERVGVAPADPRPARERGGQGRRAVRSFLSLLRYLFALSRVRRRFRWWP